MGEAKRRKQLLGKNYGEQALTKPEVAVCVHTDTFKDSYVDVTVTDLREQKTMLVKFHVFMKNRLLYAECPFLIIKNDKKEPSDEKIRKTFNFISQEDAAFAALIGENIDYLSSTVCKALKVLIENGIIVIRE